MIKLIGLTAAAIFTAEAMFGTNSYDLQGNSLKEFLRPWSQGPVDLDHFFNREQENMSIFLTPPESNDGENQPVQMRFGADLEWQKQPATVMMFYYRRDLPAHTPKVVSLT